MEKHFLDDMMDGTPSFQAEPWYNPHGDCIILQIADEAVVAERIDEVLTVYHSAIDDRPIGFQIKGVKAMIQKFGLEGLAIRSKADGGEMKSISIVALLLAAYEEGPPTLGRRKAYAEAMDYPTQMRTIRASELQPA